MEWQEVPVVRSVEAEASQLGRVVALGGLCGSFGLVLFDTEKYSTEFEALAGRAEATGVPRGQLDSLVLLSGEQQLSELFPADEEGDAAPDSGSHFNVMLRATCEHFAASNPEWILSEAKAMADADIATDRADD